MKIIPPPKFCMQDLLELAVVKMKQKVMPRITDEKNRYLHWDKIRHLKVPENFDDIEQYWHFIKFSRIQQQKNLPFIEKFSFILTDDIQKNIHEIDSKMRGSLEAKKIDDNKDRYIIRSLIDEAISSSQLEGAATTRKVARDMLKYEKTPKDHSQKMIYNNYQAIKFINDHKEDDLTPSLILELHTIVANGTMNNSDVGKLRQDNEINVVDNSTGSVLHHPPDFEELPDRLEVLCSFANGSSPDYFIHPIIRAIIVHFALAFDHPFADGNGRTTRALFYWVILKNNYWLFQYITLSTYIKEAQAQYGESFLMVESDDFDLTYFINNQLKFINQSIKGLFDYVDNKQNQQQQALKLLGAYLADGKLNPRQAMIIQHAVKHPGVGYTIAGHKLSHHVSYATAKSDLEKLEKLDLLQQSKRGRAFVFIAPNDLEQRIKAYQ
jgi:Fic family protein